MKRWFMVLSIVMIIGLFFSTAQVHASSSQLTNEEQPVVLKKTPEPKNNPGMEKKATKEAEKELRQAEKELRKAEKQLEKAEKKAGKKVHFRGSITEVTETSLTLDIGGGNLITFEMDEKTQIKIPTLGQTADWTALNIGVQASVQAIEKVASETPEEEEAEGEIQQEETPEEEVAAYLALKIHVIPGKPVRVHRVGVVVDYQPGVEITIQTKDMEQTTFLLTETTKILPAEREEDLAAGVWVTIISRRDPTGGELTAQGIVIHPKVDENLVPQPSETVTETEEAEVTPEP